MRFSPLSTKHKLLGIGVVAALVFAFTASMLYPRPASDQGPYRFIHCPNCGAEVPYNAALEGKSCLACAPEKHLLVATTYSTAQSGGPASPFARMLGPLMLEVNILLVVVWYVTLPRPAAKVDETYFTMRCFSCRRKLRYASSRAGNKGQCPQCKHPLFFPAKPPPDEGD